MVLTSDVSLIARAAKKSLENPNIHPRIRGAIKEILNCIEYCPLYPKSETKNDFDILISLKRSAKTPEEKELIEKAWSIVRRAEVNAQIRELEESMEPEEVDLEEEEEEKEESAEEKQDSESLSKPTDLHQELTAVRKDFEEYKATNDAKLEALEQKMAQMEGARAWEPPGLSSEAWESSGPVNGPKGFSGSTTQPKAPSDSTAMPDGFSALSTQYLTPEHLQELHQQQYQFLQNLANGPKPFSGSTTQPKAPSGSTARPESFPAFLAQSVTPQQLQEFHQQQYLALHNPQMLNNFVMSFPYGAFSGSTAEPKAPSGSTARPTQAQKSSGLANGPQAFSGLTTEPKAPSGSTARPTQAQEAFSNMPKGPTPQAEDLVSQQLQQIQQLQQKQYNVLQNAHPMNQLGGIGLSYFGPQTGESSGPAKTFSGSTTEPMETSSSTARPEMFPALLTQAPKASNSAAEPKGLGNVAQNLSDSTPKAFSGLTTEPKAPSGNTSGPTQAQKAPGMIFMGPSPQTLQQLQQMQHQLLQNPQQINQLMMESLTRKIIELQAETDLQSQKIRQLEAVIEVRDSYWTPLVKPGEEAEENASLRIRLDHFKTKCEALGLQVSDLTEEKERLEEKLRNEKEKLQYLQEFVRNQDEQLAESGDDDDDDDGW